MKCINCGSEMRLDDVDFNSKTNKDNYWVCDNCNTGTCEEIRAGKTSKLTSMLEDGTLINWNFNQNWIDVYV